MLFSLSERKLLKIIIICMLQIFFNVLEIYFEH